MFARRRLSKTQRRALYDREAAVARAAGRGEFPICEHCNLAITRGHDWDDCHGGAPHALGGQPTGIAHRRCNRLHGAKVVTPMVAKAARQAERDLGITGPGLGRHPMAGGRDDPRKRPMGGLWPVDRRTGEPWRFSK